ncbi:MAG: transglycosylase domain-containing protein [Bacteroidales bacterium]|nr:transglycosylase domain-containing protein [Bacteroidales bacterium]
MKSKVLLNKNYLKGIFYALLIIIFSFFIFFVLNKNYLFNAFLAKKINYIEKRYSVIINYKKVRLNSLSNVSFTDFIITKNKIDTILFADTISVNISFFEAIFGKIKIKKLFSDNVLLNIQKNNSLWNISTFLTSAKEKNRSNNIKFSYRKIIEKLKFYFEFLFNTEAELRNILVKLTNNQWLLEYIKVDTLTSFNDLIKTNIKLYDLQNNEQNYLLTLQRFSTECFLFKLISSGNNEKIKYFPGFHTKELKLIFDTINCVIGFSQINDILRLSINGELKNLRLFYPYISYKDVAINYKKAGIVFFISDKEINIHKNSILQVNNMTFNIAGKIIKDTSLKISINVFREKFFAQDLFSSLPDGLFNNLQNIKTRGFLSFNLNLIIDFNNLDNLIFNWQLKPHNFYVEAWGNFPLSKLNSEFYHLVFEKGELIDSILLSKRNPYYVSFNEVSPLLINAILCTEDPSFFVHRGFIMESFQESLIENLKRKKIVRGGSTITMQLVKNLFLNKHRVISRKLEEILITWLIENLQLCSKERIFELYLNIIEFGPKIYGISKATQFYFSKKPSMLNLNEAIFLASIIPFPKYFTSMFDDSLKVKKNFQRYFNIIAERMYMRNMISEEEYNAFNPSNVIIRGKAKEFFKNSVDTLQLKLYYNE